MKTLLKKALPVLLTGVLTAGVLAGCGGTNNSKSEESDAASDKTTLKFATSLSEEEWKVMKEDIFPEFEKANNVKVEGIQIGHGDINKKLQAMHDAGKMDIDVVGQDNMRLAQLVENGIVQDLSEYRDKIPSTIIESQVSVSEFDGKLYFMPFRPNVEINFYNEKKFKEYGLEPPKTWDELLNVAKTFKDKEGIGRLALKGTFDKSTTVQLFEFIRQAGGDPLVLNDEGCVKAFTYLKELWPYLSPDTAKADWNVMNSIIANESVYYGANWPLAVSIIVKDGGKEEIKAYEGFTGPVKASKVLGGDVIGIPEGSKNKELAVKFAEYIMSKEVQEKFVSKLSWPAARNDAYGVVEGWQKPYFDAMHKALENAEPRPNVVYWSDVDKALNEALKAIVVDGKDVKETLDKYHDIVEDAKNKK